MSEVQEILTLPNVGLTALLLFGVFMFSNGGQFSSNAIILTEDIDYDRIENPESYEDDMKKVTRGESDPTYRSTHEYLSSLRRVLESYKKEAGRRDRQARLLEICKSNPYDARLLDFLLLISKKSRGFWEHVYENQFDQFRDPELMDLYDFIKLIEQHDYIIYTDGYTYTQNMHTRTLKVVAKIFGTKSEEYEIFEKTELKTKVTHM